ncbi:ABC transporter permease [Sinorhizobium medicae]
MAVAAGILAGLAVAAVIGATNGVLIAVVGINPLVTTLGVANIVLSLASTVSDGFPVSGFPVQFSEFFAQGSVLGLPVPVVVAGLLFAALSVLMNWTRFGRSLYIIGANPKTAVAAGIRSGPVVAAAYCLCGTLIGFGALMLTARTGSGEPNLGGNLTLESIAAAVVGGVKLSGGEGGVGAALVGALFVTVLSNGMNLTQVDGYLQQICLGAIIIIALVTSRGHSRH